MSPVLRSSSRLVAVAVVAGLHLLLVLVVRSGWLSPDRRRGTVEERYTLAFLISKAPVDRTVGSSRATADVPRTLALTDPSLPAFEADISPPPAVDWNTQIAQSARAVIDEEQRRREGGSDFTPRSRKAEPPPLFAVEELGRDVPWSYRTRRIERSANGMFIVWISERCFLVAGIFPLCKIGKLAQTDPNDLFKRLKRPDASVADDTRLDTIVAVTRVRLAALAKRIAQWRERRGRYPVRMAEMFDLPGGMSAAGAAPVDPWGNRIVFAQPSSSAGCAFDLYSPGANGSDEQGGADDIVTREHCTAPAAQSPP